VSGSLERRLEALAEAAALAEGRLDGAPVAAARAVVDRAGKRLGLGLEATVVALAGSTGAGKSSLFNALAGAELTAAGRIRPTTATATAAVWGDAGGELLDWLEVPRRHRRDGDGPDGLVLLDLPDFDSVEASHRLEVERLLELVDLVVWVVDPQKYADAALHERYLRPLAGYEGAMVVVLNQADVLSGEALAACRADLSRLLGEDGLAGIPVLAASARTGEGLDALHGVLAERVAAREAALARLEADVATAAAGLAAAGGGEGAPSRRRAAGPGVRREDRDRLVDALAAAAGVPVVVRAVGDAHRRRGALATGWPYVRWVRRLRPDPLRRLRVPEDPEAVVRTSLPAASPVQRAQVDAATRALAAGAAGELQEPWPGLVRGAATAAEEETSARLDRAVAGTSLGMRAPRWWRAAAFLQRVLALVAAAGALWLAGLAGLGYLQVNDLVPTPDVLGLPLPTLLLLGGIAAGLALALAARLANGVSARRRARRAGAALRTRVAQVADELIVAPVEAELAARTRLQAALAEAGPRRPA
jgi:GTP-binding protein EngB required for normal cell division